MLGLLVIVYGYLRLAQEIVSLVRFEGATRKASRRVI
jgi:hypothetical protein